MLFWYLAIPAIAVAFLSLRGEWKRARYVSERLAEEHSYLPPVSLIVPVKGEDEGLRENLASLASLDYPDYELIIAARSAADIPAGVLPRRVRVVLANGGDPHTAEKIQNLAAAVGLARRDTRVFAFADSDGRVQRSWLRHLVAPLADSRAGASTGYRWYAPDPPDFWSLMRSVWNAPVFGLLGPSGNPFAWGGAMAIRRETFAETGVMEHWRGAISDDYVLTRAVRGAGLEIAFAPGAMVASTDHIQAGEFFRWIRRQAIITRVYHPRLWWGALIAHIVYCAGMTASISAIANGSLLAEWALIAQLGPGMLKGSNRATLAKAELPDFKPWFGRHAWVHAIWVPLATWFWLYALVASAFARAIEWRGYRYELYNTGEFGVKGREGQEQT